MVKRACNACQVCEQVKAVQHTQRTLLQPILSGYPNQRLGLDIMGPFPQSRTGNVYLLVMVNFFTKWAEAAPLPNQEARTVAEAVFTHWVVRYGTPDTIRTDQGSKFESRLVYEMCRLAGIQKTRTTPYHPQGNGQTERTNRSLLTMLRSFVQQARNDTWDEMLPQCLMAYRCTIHRSTGETPAMMTLGYEMRLPFDTQLPQSQQSMLELNPFMAIKCCCKRTPCN